MDWDKIRIFYAVARAGSFTAAGEKLNVNQSSVSRQITNLEYSLKMPLFHRHARGLVLTEQGRILFKSAQEISQKIILMQQHLTDNKDKPSGILTINIDIALGSMWLAPMIKDFKTEFPDIEIHIICSEVELDVAMLEADIAILQHQTTSLDIIQKKIMRNRVKAYASQKYLERRGKPKTTKDLRNHDIIVYDTTLDSDNNLHSNWLLNISQSTIPLSPYMAINNLHGMYRVVRSGAGIAALPEFMEGLPGGLVNILPELEGPEFDIYIAYPPEHKNTSKVQVFKDFLVEKSKPKR